MSTLKRGNLATLYTREVLNFCLSSCGYEMSISARTETKVTKRNIVDLSGFTMFKYRDWVSANAVAQSAMKGEIVVQSRFLP